MRLQQLANVGVTFGALILVVGWCLFCSGCAGLPVGHHTHLFIGFGLVRVDRAGKATAISSRSLGIFAGCQSITIGVQASYCARIPIDGNLAIIERASGPDQHLILSKLQPKEKSP